MKRPFIRAAALTALALALSASPAVALRDDAGGKKGKVTWDVQGGTPTNPGDSADGPKKTSNAYTMTPGSYVYPDGYWDMALAASSWKFTYKVEDLTHAGQVRWSINVKGTGLPGDQWIYLDPFHCHDASSTSTWETTDFTRTGADCAIYVSWQTAPFVGTDTTSAWDQLVASIPGATVYYGFVIVDDAGSPITVDRVMAGGNLLSKF